MTDRRSTMDKPNLRIFCSHSVEFATAHFYRQPLWSSEKNEKEFGACFRPYGHGHNYKLHVTFEMKPDKVVSHTPESRLAAAPGNLFLTQRMDTILKNVVSPFDHHHISFEHPVFSGPDALVPTAENIALHLMKQLITTTATDDFKVVGLTLHEDEAISAEIGLSKRTLFDKIAVLEKTMADGLKPPPFESRLTLKNGESFQVKFHPTSKLNAPLGADKNSYVSEKAREANSLPELCVNIFNGSDPVVLTTRNGHFFFAGFFSDFFTGDFSTGTSAGA